MMPPVRLALDLASLFALCSFLIAVVALVAYRLDWLEILQPLANGPALHPLTALGVILLAVCIVLATPCARYIADGICMLVLLGALARLLFPRAAGRWL
ncbi:MAG: hypothetical protein PVJ15_08755, partial [Gammaproteobacteria bacterium]